MKFGMVFPGYGSQFVGMGKELYDTQRLVQEYFEEAATCLSINFVKLCFASSEVELAKPCHAYTSLFLMGACSAGLLKERQCTPAVVAGVDVTSWYSSLFAAGSITLPDGLYMLNKIGTVYEDMLAKQQFSAIIIKNATKMKIAELCRTVSNEEQVAALANILPDGFLVTGHAAAIEKLESLITTAQKITYEAADVGGGLYISAAESIALQVNTYLEKIDFKQPQIPIISPLTGKLLKKSDELKHLSSIMCVQQLDQLAVIKKIMQYGRICMAVPAIHLAAKLAESMPNDMLDTMEDSAQLVSLQNRYQMLEVAEEETHVE